MKSTYIGHGAAAMALGAALLVMPGKVQGQGPLYDRVDVNLPYTVTIGDKTLEPGDYVIQQMHSASDSRVLLIYGNNGMRFETSAMTIPTLDPNTARDTKVILHHFGNDYYFDKIWIQGKDYGYEFPLPNSVKQREKEEMQPVSVAANYSATPPPTETATSSLEAATPAQQPTTPPPATAQEQTTPPAAEQPQTSAEQPQTSAQTQQTMPPATEANREAPSTMPTTSAGWLMMLLSGGTLSGMGLALRRRR